MEDLAYANHLCDELGLDTISTGNAIGFAAECFEKGIIGTQETDCIDIRWGDAAAIFAMIEKIANREGIGDILAEGVRHAATQFGGDSGNFAMQIKGMEISGYESRGGATMLLSYMTCDVGGHHNRSWGITYDVQVGGSTISADKAAKVIELQHKRPLFDALGACRFPWVEIGFDLDQYAPILKAATGVDRTTEDLLRVSERIWNLTRLYWFREIEGFGRRWDLPPARTWRDPVSSGPTAGKRISRADVETLLDMYYEQRGWDENGFPTAAKLAQLGLTELAGR
jgi:aldehyde:ferredoxin oxidoreductase